MLRREMGDKKGIAGALHSLGVIAAKQGDYASAQVLLEESLALERELGDRRGIAYLLNSMGPMELAQGDYNSSRKLFEESLALMRELGDNFGIAVVLFSLGNLTRAQGDYTEARLLYEDSLTLCGEMDDKWIMGGALLGLGLVDLAEGTHEAREHILQGLRIYKKLGDKTHQIACLIGFVGLVLHGGNPQHAAQLLGAVESELKRLKIVVDFELQSFHAQTLAAVREQLGELAFQSAWEVGAQWSLEKAIHFALGDQEIGNRD